MSARTRIALALVVLGATACAPETPQAPQNPEPSRTSTPVPSSTPSVTTASPTPLRFGLPDEEFRAKPVGWHRAHLLRCGA